jgi:hypothetical protein
VGFELTTLVVVGTDCIGTCKSNYHTIMTTAAPFIIAKLCYCSKERERERERETVVNHPWVLTIIKKILTRGKGGGGHFFYRRAAEIGRLFHFF